MTRSPGIGSESIGAETDLTPAWLEAAAFDPDVTTRGLAEVLQFGERLAREAEIGRICDEGLAAAGFVDHIVVDHETKDRVLAIIGDRETHMLVKMPY